MPGFGLLKNLRLEITLQCPKQRVKSVRNAVVEAAVKGFLYLAEGFGKVFSPSLENLFFFFLKKEHARFSKIIVLEDFKLRL